MKLGSGEQHSMSIELTTDLQDLMQKENIWSLLIGKDPDGGED